MATATFSLTINNGATQRSMVTALALTSDQALPTDATRYVLNGTSPQGQSLTVAPTVVVSGNSAAMRFQNDNSGGTNLRGKPAQDQFGNPLYCSLGDGRWTLSVLDADGNPVWTSDEFTCLFGDNNADGAVDLTDYGSFSQANGSNNPTFEYDGVGPVGAHDYNRFAERMNVSL